MTSGSPAHDERLTFEDEVAASIRDVFRRNFARIVAEFKAKGVSQRQLGEMLGVDQTVVSFWKNGDRYPEPHHIDRIVTALGVRAEDLFHDPTELRFPPANRSAHDPLPEGWVEVLRQVAEMAGFELVKKPE